ncbi:hypothetical protein [Vibrio mediterranei]|uniref:hypothetical protein n=1 Tax=Vibrio mediterranei TaxID=689 RepID=UPI004068FF31
MIENLLLKWSEAEVEVDTLRQRIEAADSDARETMQLELLEVHGLLGLLYPSPQNGDLKYRWMGLEHRQFGERKPIDVLNSEGCKVVTKHLKALCYK